MGYIAFALICGFAPLQLMDMARNKHRDLGLAPMISLVLGLWLLELSLYRDGVWGYLFWGNTVSMTFNTLALLLTWRRISEGQ